MLQYGPPVPPPAAPAPYSPPTYLTLYGTPQGVQFSQVKNGYSDPYSTSDAADVEAAKTRQLIQKELKSAGWKVFQGTYETQVIDPMFLEPEAGLAWYDRANQSMNLVMGTQSTNGDLSDAFSLFNTTPPGPLNVKRVVLNACYPGGGFGGRDVSIFPLMMLLAAAYAEGPVRIAYDRFESVPGRHQAARGEDGADLRGGLEGTAPGRRQPAVPAGRRPEQLQPVGGSARGLLRRRRLQGASGRHRCDGPALRRRGGGLHARLRRTAGLLRRRVHDG